MKKVVLIPVLLFGSLQLSAQEPKTFTPGDISKFDKKYVRYSVIDGDTTVILSMPEVKV